MAVLFDVTPGLRGRGGLVLFFFASMFLLLFLPGQIAGIVKDGKPAASDVPVFDPAGIVTLDVYVQHAIPEAASAVSGFKSPLRRFGKSGSKKPSMWARLIVRTPSAF